MKLCRACRAEFDAPSWVCPSCGARPAEIGGHLSFAPGLAAENDGFDASGFQRLFELEPGNYWFEARNKLVVWALGRWFPDFGSLLEIGCGTGFVLAGIQKHFPRAELVGTEIHSRGLDYAARRLPGVELLQMDARQIPFAAEFDAIGAFDTLEHIQDDEGVLRQVWQALVPNGGLILTVPQHRWLWSYADEFALHKRRYSRAELTRKLREAGFRVLGSTSFVTLPLPALLLSRAGTQRAGAGGYNPAAEMALPAPLNRALRAVLDSEVTLIRQGLRLPVGGSLLMAACKEPHTRPSIGHSS